jgi:hypothetical protein
MFPVVLLVVGLVLWFIANRKEKPGIWPSVGQIMFACGLLVTTFVLAGHRDALP